MSPREAFGNGAGAGSSWGDVAGVASSRFQFAPRSAARFDRGMAVTIRLGPDGNFQRDGVRFFPIGARIQPREVAALEEDVSAMRRFGLNTVRVSTAAEADAVHSAAAANGLVVFCDATDLVAPLEEIRFSAQPGTHVLGFDGLVDPFFHSFLPFTAQVARVRGRVPLISLGAGVPEGARAVAAWLGAALPATPAAGFFWEAWRGPDGLVGADGNPRPGRDRFMTALARDRLSGAIATSAVGILVPGSSPLDLSARRRLLLAGYALKACGVAAGLTSDPRGYATLLLPGLALAQDEVANLRAWVAGGGTLLWHGPDPLAWDDAMQALLGARPVDWRSSRGISVNAFGERFTLAHFPQDVRAELELCGAAVLAADHQDFPLLLEHRVGRGCVRYALPIVEEAIVPVAAHPHARDRWIAWYRGMLGRPATGSST